MEYENYENMEAAVLEFIRQPGYRPLKPRQIAKKLKVADDDIQDFKRLVKQLVKRGILTYGEKHLVRLPGSPASPGAGGKSGADQRGGNKKSGITGVFRRTQSGFGFVRPLGAGLEHTREQDLFVAAEHAADASSGDTVLVRLLKENGKGRGKFRNPRAAIVEVLERETHKFVGTYFESAGAAFVQVDGTVFTRPVAVGDPGAKSAQPDDKVVFEMVRFPSQVHDGEGVITEVLGARGTPGVDTLSIIREFNLPEAFAEDTLQAAREEAEKFDETQIGDRRDLTASTVITIDPVDARDFDDAISLERLENGHWRLGVHIADVSHFVRPGTALDREAHARSTSVYLPDRVIPMIPEIISNGLASLQPDRVRYTKTAFLEFTADGVRTAIDLHSAAIKSQRRFTYEEVDDYLAHPNVWKKKLSKNVFELLGRMHELAMILRKRRFVRGSLELSMQEVKVDLDKDGRVVGAHKVENTESHQIIEEFMLAANDAVAETIAEADLHFLRRVHQSPDPRKLKALTEFVSEMGFKTESLESRFELQKLLDTVHDRPERQAVNYAVLRSLSRAVYSPADEGHYALASDCYCHFTSPIRRYPDLTIHRLVNYLANKHQWKDKPRNDLTELVVLGEHCSNLERRAEAAERELTKAKLLHYLSERIGDEMDAVVTGVEEFGLFAQGIELPAEGMIHVSSLADDFYRYERASHRLTGHRSGNSFRLGDMIRVAVARVDVERRELDFRLVARGAPTGPKRRPSSKDKARRPSKKSGKPTDEGKRKRKRK